jgi:flagellar hook-associated protein 3 FlgL
MIDLTNQMTYRIGNLDIQSQRISYQMSTGKVLENGSDNSVVYGKFLNVETNLRTYEGLELQIQKVTAQNNVADSTIAEIKTTLDAIKIDLLKSLNSGMTRADRVAVAKNMEGMRDNLYSLVNTRIDGEYMFSGSDTTVTSYVQDPLFKINGQIDFKGNGHLRNIAVDPGVYRERGVTAYDVLMYNKDTSEPDDIIKFTEHDDVIDENGNSWRFIDHDNADGDNDITTGIDKNRLYKIKEDGKLSKFVDGGGVLVPEYITVTADASTPINYTSQTLSSARVADTISEVTHSGIKLEAKHNVFDELNVILKALNGYKTIRNDASDNGEQGAIATDVEVRNILSTALGEISKQFDATNVGHAKLGGRNTIFEVALDRITSQVTHYNILMQTTNGADMAKLAMESKSLELTYNALYSTVSKLNELSLVNFLR